MADGDPPASACSWRFCATVLNGFEKPARQELATRLQPWGPLELHSTKAGRMFFTLKALRDSGAAPDGAAGSVALQVMSRLETVEHLFAVAAEGDYMLVEGGLVVASSAEDVHAVQRAPLADPSILTIAAQQIPAARWAACDALAVGFQAVSVCSTEVATATDAAELVGLEPQPETQEMQPLRTFRVDVKCGSHGGRAKSSVRRTLGMAVASGVAATTGWEPVLSAAGVTVCVFLSLAGNSRTPQFIAGVRLTTVPLGAFSAQYL